MNRTIPYLLSAAFLSACATGQGQDASNPAFPHFAPGESFLPAWLTGAWGVDKAGLLKSLQAGDAESGTTPSAAAAGPSAPAVSAVTAQTDGSAELTAVPPQNPFPSPLLKSLTADNTLQAVPVDPVISAAPEEPAAMPISEAPAADAKPALPALASLPEAQPPGPASPAAPEPAKTDKPMVEAPNPPDTAGTSPDAAEQADASASAFAMKPAAPIAPPPGDAAPVPESSDLLLDLPEGRKIRLKGVEATIVEKDGSEQEAPDGTYITTDKKYLPVKNGKLKTIF